ncbi:hypothetical protein H2201_006538 [Coniosporium apollinis]|uniref:Uncharacterized protein n=2 Tax=Coniosporium TaxID=2810619 RepID=A0ABQ9NQ08_9PEZI|nr:hypothetical protein H2199_003771 [Cladosporium sp. JES 115]KAJ9661346.1 hypothetical protein H2201_006538 [Coniosporium apollinis]
MELPWVFKQQWYENNKVFPIMKLPGEIRNRIYLNLFEDRCYPFRYRTYPRPGGREISTQLAPEQAVVYLSKQTRNEFLGLLFSETMFCFNDVGDMERFARFLENRRGPLTERHQPLKVEIDLKQIELLNVFGAKLTPALQWVPNAAMICLLDKPTKLKELHIIIPCPADLMARRARSWELVSEEWCHRKVIDQFLKAAFGYIKAHEKVVFYGYIKETQQAQAFDMIGFLKAAESKQNTLEKMCIDKDDEFGGAKLPSAHRRRYILSSVFAEDAPDEDDPDDNSQHNRDRLDHYFHTHNESVDDDSDDDDNDADYIRL